MSSCDLCGRELVNDGDRMQLYVGKLVGREVGKGRVTSSFKNLQPVELRLCRRHRWDVVKQRIMPMLIGFILLFLPIQFLISLIAPLFSLDIIWQVILTFAVDAVIVFLLSRFITYDALVAHQMNQRSREAGVEYVPQRKYRTLMRRLER